jgi:hypothetical protein
MQDSIGVLEKKYCRFINYFGFGKLWCLEATNLILLKTMALLNCSLFRLLETPAQASFF